MTKKNIINKLGDEFELIFAKPAKLDIATLLHFGNVRGIYLIVNANNRVKGLKFKDKETLRLFFEIHAPEKLPEINRIISELEDEENGK